MFLFVQFQTIHLLIVPRICFVQSKPLFKNKLKIKTIFVALFRHVINILDSFATYDFVHCLVNSRTIFAQSKPLFKNEIKFSVWLNSYVNLFTLEIFKRWKAVAKDRRSSRKKSKVSFWLLRLQNWKPKEDVRRPQMLVPKIMWKNFSTYDFVHCLTASRICFAQSKPLFRNKIKSNWNLFLCLNKNVTEIRWPTNVFLQIFCINFLMVKWRGKHGWQKWISYLNSRIPLIHLNIGIGRPIVCLLYSEWK